MKVPAGFQERNHDSDIKSCSIQKTVLAPKQLPIQNNNLSHTDSLLNDTYLLDEDRLPFRFSPIAVSGQQQRKGNCSAKKHRKLRRGQDRTTKRQDIKKTEPKPPTLHRSLNSSQVNCCTCCAVSISGSPSRAVSTRVLLGSKSSQPLNGVKTCGMAPTCKALPDVSSGTQPSNRLSKSETSSPRFEPRKCCCCLNPNKKEFETKQGV